MKAEVSFVPRGNNVLVDRLPPEEMSRGGVLIPDVAKDNPLMGKVLALGPGKEIPFDCRLTSARNIANTSERVVGVGDIVRHEPIAELKIGDLIFFNIRHAVPCNTREHGQESRLCLIDADQILAVVVLPERN